MATSSVELTTHTWYYEGSTAEDMTQKFTSMIESLTLDATGMGVTLQWASLNVETEVDEYYTYSGEAKTSLLTMTVKGTIND